MKKTELHSHLCQLMRQVEIDKDIQPVVKIINSFGSNAKTRLDIVKWVQAFSPFMFSEKADGKLRARLSKEGKFCLDAGINSPYWQSGDKGNISTKEVSALEKVQRSSCRINPER